MAYTTIKKPSDYFNTLLWTGNSSTQSITGNDFIADLTWSKTRSNAESHILMDTVRDAGTTLNQQIKSDSSSLEGILNNSSTLTVNSTGFDLSGTTGGPLNFNGYTYATWLWKAGGNTGVSNSDGSTASTVNVNTTSGFSIVRYTGPGGASTVGHGLGSAPKVVIVKSITSNLGWRVYHYSVGATKTLYLNESNAATTDSLVWNNTAPTSTVFSIGSASEVSADYSDFIAYCFSEVKGFSKFGSYTGNGSTDGTFVYTGFKPAFVIVKRTDLANDWNMQDTKRQLYNGQDGVSLHANAFSSEAGIGTGYEVDYLSNGFKRRNAGSETNASGGTYIYMAFAEEPLVGDNPATAR